MGQFPAKSGKMEGRGAKDFNNTKIFSIIAKYCAFKNQGPQPSCPLCPPLNRILLRNCGRTSSCCRGSNPRPRALSMSAWDPLQQPSQCGFPYGRHPRIYKYRTRKCRRFRRFCRGAYRRAHGKRRRLCLDNLIT